MGSAILYTNAQAMGKMPAREERMPKPAKKAKQAFWERGYLAHGYWLGKERLGEGKLGPKKGRDGVLPWRGGKPFGGSATPDQSQRAREQALLVRARHV